MRRSLLLAFVVFAAAIPAAAAGPDPRALVLAPADVPAGFRLVPDESGVRTNEAEAKVSPEARAFFVRWKRVTGYRALYERRTSKIEARSDIFSTAAGADALVEWADREWRLSGIAGQRRSAIRIGAKGVLYWWDGSAPPRALVLWRHDRVFSGLNVSGLSRAKTIALARKQQRRIAAALR